MATKTRQLYQLAPDAAWLEVTFKGTLFECKNWLEANGYKRHATTKDLGFMQWVKDGIYQNLVKCDMTKEVPA